MPIRSRRVDQLVKGSLAISLEAARRPSETVLQDPQPPAGRFRVRVAMLFFTTCVCVCVHALFAVLLHFMLFTPDPGFM